MKTVSAATAITAFAVALVAVTGCLKSNTRCTDAGGCVAGTRCDAPTNICVRDEPPEQPEISETPDEKDNGVVDAGVSFETWNLQDASTKNAAPASIAALDEGLVVGGSLLSSDGVTRDGFVKKYSQHGQLEWTTLFSTSVDDGVSAVGVDSTGTVVVFGSTKGSLQGPNSGGDDIFLARLDPLTGKSKWPISAVQLGSSVDEAAMGAAFDDQGNAYAAVWRRDSSGDGNEVWKVDSSGAIAWKVPLEIILPLNVALSGNALYVGGLGNPQLVKFDLSGAVLWRRQYPELHTSHFSSLLPTDSGGVFASTLGHVIRIGDDGTVVWHHTSGIDLFSEADPDIPSMPVFQDLSFNVDGDLVLVGSTRGAVAGATSAGGYDAYIARFDLAGTPRGLVEQFGTTRDDRVNQVTRTREGALYVVGATGTAGNRADMFIRRLAR